MPLHAFDATVGARLTAGLQAFGLEDLELPGALLHYLRELVHWNAAYNLTAIRDPAEMVTRHLLDSLALLPHLHGGFLVDVGCGAGLPGIPLHLADAVDQTLLVDSNGKKVRFCRHVIAELGLEQIEARQARVETLPADLGADVVVSRAYASLAEFAASAGHVLRPGGQLYAMKGRLPSDEIDALPGDWEVTEQLELTVPGLDEERWLICLRQR